jgi:hypothetical protein
MEKLIERKRRRLEMRSV